MDQRTINSVKCQHCEDGIIWIESEPGKSSMYRCPYCEKGLEFAIQDLPMLPLRTSTNGPKRPHAHSGNSTTN